MGNLIQSGNVTFLRGGATFRTSAGTVCALFYDTSAGGIKAFKDVDGTPSQMGATQTGSMIHGTGDQETAYFDACIDSNDVIHVLALADDIDTTDYKDVMYNTITGVDSTPAWGTWEQVSTLSGMPSYPSCQIEVDGNDYPRCIWTDEYFYKGAYYSGPYYSHDVGSGWITKERVDTSDQHCSYGYCMTVEASSGDVEVAYQAVDTIYHRRRNGSWGTRESLTQDTYGLCRGLLIDSGTVTRVHKGKTSGYLYEDNTQITTDIDPASYGYAFDKNTVVMRGGTKYVVYIDDASDDVYVGYDSGSGWTDDGVVDEATVDYLIADKGNIDNAPSGVVDIIYIASSSAYHVAYGEGGTTDNLTASDLSASAAVLGGPTIGQKHALSASDLTSSAPVLGTPTLATEGEDNLTANDLDLAAAVLGGPTLGQKHALQASALEITPLLGTPTLSTAGEDNLDARDLDLERPVLGEPTLGHKYVLGADALTTTPALGQPTLSEIVNLSASDLDLQPAALGTPTLATMGTDALDADDLDAAAAILGQPAIGQKHALGADDLTTTPVLGAPTLSTQGTDVLIANDLVGGTPDLESPALGQKHSLAASALATTPVLGQPTLGQVHSLDTDDLEITPVLGTPSVGLYDDLTASDLTGGTPVLGTPTLGLVGDALYSADLISEAPVLGTPTLAQIHHLDAVGITVASYSLPSPALLFIPEDYVTPRERWYCPPHENRTSKVKREFRELAVPAENREFSPKPPVG